MDPRFRCFRSHRQNINAAAHGRLVQANAKVDAICSSSGVPGSSIGVLRNGKIFHTYNYGYTHLDARSLATADTVYGIGSLTKAFVAAAIGQLVDDGNLSWDAPVHTVLPAFRHDDPDVAKSLTIADILSHRSGLSGLGAMSLAFQGDGDMLLPKSSLFSLVNHFPVSAPIRSTWAYFVWGYSLAGAVIEEVTQKPLKEFVDEAIFKPFGMRNTSFKPGDFASTELAGPHAGLSNGSAFHLPKLQVFEDTFFEASGGIYSSVNDMLIWASNMLQSARGSNGASPPLVKGADFILSNHIAVFNPSLAERSYGFGWTRAQLPGVVVGENLFLWPLDESPVLGSRADKTLMAYHYGSTVGYQSFIALLPETDSAVVVLTNSMGTSHAADWIARTMIQALLGIDDGNNYVELAREASRRNVQGYDEMFDDLNEMRAACPTSKRRDPAAFLGNYSLDSGLFTIAISPGTDDNSGLVLRFQGLDSQAYALRHFCEDVFEWALTFDESRKRGRYGVSAPSYYLFQFHVDGDEAISLSWDIDVWDNPVVFTKRQ
ncbi:beta-lactamase/transpeptidase-like protein [Hypoxylon rubiginosum]|uniref:Beta-lactamase/transpeptidase-like protein n=1 Tax=Hypoxylon rubiginosum TaxID=110542 RepID=A0ACB9ZFU0_9PEZI|nr:beta-lactamase/transpeptidase-like protein [Hypoxylon rubiginosum]